MKISIRSDQESLVIYVGRAEASRHIITVTVILVGMGLLFFTGGVFFLVELLLEDQGIMKKDVKFNNIIFSFFYSGFFWLRGIPMAIGSPKLLAQFKKDDGAIMVAANKEGLSITLSPYAAFSTFSIKANYTWTTIEKILLIKQFAWPDSGKETWNQIAIYLRDNPAEKNKCWWKRKIWGKNIEKVNLDGLSEDQRSFIKNELIRLSCQKVKII